MTLVSVAPRMNYTETDFFSEVYKHFPDIVAESDVVGITITCEDFTLCFGVQENIFTIRNIVAEKKRKRIGSRIVQLIKTFCDAYCMIAIIAENVRESATIFWEKQGFKRTAERSNHYRCIVYG